MRGGEASTVQLFLTNLDLANAAATMLRGDEASKINCAVAAVHAKSGVVEPELFVIDTSAVVINGEGSVDMRNEKLDLRLSARSKRPSLVALRGPIVVQGSFAHPTARPSLVQAGARVGAAVGLGAIAGPLALLPLIDLGGADDVDCRAVIADAQEKTATTERIQRPGTQAKAKRGTGDNRANAAKADETTN
jgi:hypothetical protein